MIYTNENWKPPVTYCEPNKVEVQRMNKEEAIEILRDIYQFLRTQYTHRYKQKEAIDLAIKALEELPKRRKEVKRWKRKALHAEPVKHGEWVRLEIKGIINPLTGKNRTYTGCSCCGEPIPTDSILDFIEEEEVNFCFGCGAKMKGQEE